MSELIAFDAPKNRKKSHNHTSSAPPPSKLSATEQHYTKSIHRSGGASRPPFFDRRELNQILQCYSQKVMSGHWLDYAINHDETGAIFAIYGRVTAVPLFTVHKQGRANKPEQRYQVQSRGKILRSDRSLSAVLKYLEARAPTLIKS